MPVSHSNDQYIEAVYKKDVKVYAETNISNSISDILYGIIRANKVCSLGSNNIFHKRKACL